MFSIGLVSRETGISIATLRKWEERYGFPKPKRTDGNSRTYSEEDVAYLREVKRLIDVGIRPAKLFASSATEFQALVQHNQTLENINSEQPFIDDVLNLLISHEVKKLRKILEKKLKKLGTFEFIEKIAQPLTVLVGEKWAAGSISVFTEHCYSEQMSLVLNSVNALQLKCDESAPRILLTTLSGEKHTLGLDMARALLTEQKACCISLGAELPLLEIPKAVAYYDINIVGLSFSSSFPKRAMSQSLKQLRAALPQEIALWVGGTGVKQLLKIPEGIEVCCSSTEIVSTFLKYTQQFAVPDN
jgi:MerR family transcriptional regulator, light-induced transcriptional regulator